MTKFITRTPKLTKVKLTMGDAYIKPPSFKMLPLLEKLSDPDRKDRNILLSMLMKGVLVDENGCPFEDLESCEPGDISDIFSIQDFSDVMALAMPEPVGDDDQGKLL